MARQVSRKTGRVLKQTAAPPPPTCNCQRARKPNCPVPGKCTMRDVCYKCEVVRDDNHYYETYTGQTSRPIKKRIGDRGCQFVLFMQMTTFSIYKTKPNLQVKAKKTVCITSKLLLFSIFFFVCNRQTIFV